MKEAYNYHLKKHIVLSEGEKVCPKCKGKGRIPKNNGFFTKHLDPSLICDKCFGDGKIDWIEQVTGKQHPNHKHVFGND